MKRLIGLISYVFWLTVLTGMILLASGFQLLYMLKNKNVRD